MNKFYLGLREVTDEELNQLLVKQKVEIYKLEELINAEREKLYEIQAELDTRKEWHKETVLSTMEEQLKENKSILGDLTFARLLGDIKTASGLKSARIGRAHERGNFGRLIRHLYFDLDHVIKPELLKVGKFKRHGDFIVKFEFDYKTSKIKTKIKTDMFKYTGDDINFEFKITRSEVRQLKKIVVDKFEKEFDDFNKIIPMMVSVIETIRDEFNYTILAHTLSEI